MSQRQRDFDVVVIGSGFGGSVAALRLTEKGYRVAVIEAGRRFKDKDFPKTSWRLSRFLYLPRLGLRGIQRIHALPDVLVLAGAGVGGGSLVYANTLYVPPDSYFNDNNGRRSQIGNQNSLLGMTKHHECWVLQKILTSHHQIKR